MMGYTHAVIGACGAITLATISGNWSAETYMIASVAGALGGTAIDIDTKDRITNPKVTDAGRTRLAVIGLVAFGVIMDFVLKTGIIREIVSRQYYSLGGMVAFIILGTIGSFTPHRTFSHSLLFILLTSLCIGFVYPTAMKYYFIGSILHLLLDMLNNPYNGHGIWLLYPLKRGNGIALRLCQAARKGNKAFYFVGIVLFAIVSVFYMWLIGDIQRTIMPVLILAYATIVMHFVRKKSEKEQRHIMHMRGEL
jgi:inner membrane protein